VDVLEKIKTLRYDQILEKHEGPESWESKFQYGSPEFMTVNGRDVLLPVQRKQHANITILRAIMSQDGKTLTLFLKDTTYTSDSEYAWLDAGRLAICEKMPDEDFFVATVYHEWMIVKNALLGDS
jgi:hypothetical protein